jgi:sugar lactone lactonase YvrE
MHCGLYKIKRVTVKIWNVGAEVGECPVWDASTDSLWWVDIRRPVLHRQSADGASLGRWALPSPVGAFALLAEGSRALVALSDGLALLDLESGQVQGLIDPEPDKPFNRLNEGKVSPCGRWFVFGSMDDRAVKAETGALYSFGTDGRVRQLVGGLTVANGVAWSPDAATLYYSDSKVARIWTAAWNATSGTMGESRLFAAPSETEGRPDGAAMDTEGHYWSAGVSAGRLNRFAPDGRLVETVYLPMQAPTMPAFGPPGSGRLYVTSHRRVSAPGPDDGAIAVVPTTRTGLPQPRFAMPLPRA